jgi:DUF4097 and DUF4098 domain-containing protein YvlB
MVSEAACGVATLRRETSNESGWRKRAGWLGAALLAGALLAGPASAHRIEKTLAVELRPVVTVRNDFGKVTVRSWNRSEVQVVGEHASDKLEVDVDQLGNRIDVTTHVLSKSASPAEMKADYEITVPEETELQIKNDAGMIVVERVSGELTFETVAADMQVQEVAGLLVVKSVGGSLVCIRCASRIEASTIGGNLRFVQPFSTYIKAKTTSGSIFFEGRILSSGSYMFNNTLGPIELRLDENDSFLLSAKSAQGKVELDPNLRLSPDQHANRGASGFVQAGSTSRSLAGRSGGGSGHARIELTNYSGNISIRKRD